MHRAAEPLCFLGENCLVECLELRRLQKSARNALYASRPRSAERCIVLAEHRRVQYLEFYRVGNASKEIQLFFYI